MVSSTGEGEFASVSLTAPSRAFADYAGTLARASSIAHWQLRDLVCCASNPCASVPSSSASSSSTRSQRSSDASAYDPQLFVVRHCSTLRYSIRDRKSSVAQALPFAPTSMTAGHGFIAAGGQHGQLDVRRLSDGAVVMRGAAGGSVNNALALSDWGDDGGGNSVTLFVCNNDCSIKAFALPPSAPPPSRGGEAPSRRSGSRRRGVRGGGGGDRRSGGGENDENEAMELDGGAETDNDDDGCDEFSDGEDGDGGGAAAVAAAEAAADTVAAAFEDHHFDSLEQEQQEQHEQRQRRRRQQQQRGRAAGGSEDVEAGRETLMASLEARVAAAVAAAVGAAAAATGNGGFGSRDTALRPRSASNDNVVAGGGSGGGRGGNPPPPSSSSAVLRRRANATAAAAAAAANASAPASSARAARLAASAPAAIVRFRDPVNYCAPSPAGARGVSLAAVGDCPSLSLHAPAEAGYSPLASWDLFDDAGMACAWSGSGSFVAAAAQCGLVACVDPRVGRRAVMSRNVVSAASSSSSSSSSCSSSSSVVARWRTPGGGAARALKASPAGSAADLLLVTEHDSFAHLVDARRFDAAQTLEIGVRQPPGSDSRGGGGGTRSGGGGLFYGIGLDGLGGSGSGPTANGGHHLSGAAFSPEGDLAFVGAEDGGVAVFDVRTAERCSVGEGGYR